MSEVAGALGAIFINVDAPTTFTKEATTDNGLHTSYQITNSVKRLVDRETTVLVYIDDVLISENLYTIDYIDGKINFPIANAVGEVITVSGKYLTLSQQGGFYNWKLNNEFNTIDTSTFGNTWKTSMSSLKSWTASAEYFFYNDVDYADIADSVMVFKFVTNIDMDWYYIGFGTFSKNSITLDVNDVVKASLEIIGVGEVKYVD